MPALVLQVLAAAVLAGSALLKLAAPRATRSALATFGLRAAAPQWVAWTALVAAELGLAAGVLAGSDAAAYAAAGLMLVLAAALAAAIAGGRTGAPCGCFGARSRVSGRGVARNLGFATLLAALPLVPGGEVGTEQWLAVGLVVALVAIAALAVAVLALARQVGELRLAVGTQSALEIAGEGPEIGERTPLIERFSPGERVRFALAVFTSDGCPVCASLAPAVALLGRDPLVAVEAFDEVADQDAWRALHVPGAPYAVALGLDGTVLAKGTFNSLPQLESVLGTAERREAEMVGA